MKRRSRDEEREQRITMEIVVDAYRMVAPKKLLVELDRISDAV